MLRYITEERKFVIIYTIFIKIPKIRDISSLNDGLRIIATIISRGLLLSSKYFISVILPESFNLILDELEEILYN